MTMKNDTKIEEKNLLVVLKLAREILWILTRALGGLKKFNGLLVTKVYNFWTKKEEWCKICRKTDLWFEKWHEKFGRFSQKDLKVSKLRLWWDSFVQSRKGVTIKFTEG